MAKTITRTFTGTHYQFTCATSDRNWRVFRISSFETKAFKDEFKLKNHLQNYMNIAFKTQQPVCEVITDAKGKERYEYAPLSQQVAVMLIDSEIKFEELRSMSTDFFYANSKCIKVDGMDVTEK